MVAFPSQLVHAAITQPSESSNPHFKHKKESIVYEWTSGLVAAALQGRGHHLRVIIQYKEFTLDSWYPPRVATWIMLHLAAAGKCLPSQHKAYKVSLAGCGWHQPVGCFGLFDSDKLGGLLWGLMWYHRKLRREAARVQQRQRARENAAGYLGLLAGYVPQGGCTVKK